MNPQGSSIINLDTYASLTDSINASGSCAELQELVNTAFAELDAVKAGIMSELAALTPMLALLTAPSANPAAIVTWITNFITSIVTPLVKPTITFEAQLAAALAQLAEISASISIAAGKFPSCSISIPS